MNVNMSSHQHCNKAYTLTSLPLSILARILRYLCPHNPFDRTNRLAAPFLLPFKDPRVVHSLFCAETLTVQLPIEFLPPALTSPVLAAAVVKILGNRVSYLTHYNTSGQLAAWIKAFAPYVRAIRDEDPVPPWSTDEAQTQISQELEWPSDFATKRTTQQLVSRREHSLHLFKTLFIHGVMLEVLDFRDVHFLYLHGSYDEIVAGLCTTLESNSGTLRELALPAFETSDVCDRALQMSHLKKLDVLTVKVWDSHVVEHSKRLLPPVVRMIRAVDGHADRSLKLTTLREIRLENIGCDQLGDPHLITSDRKSHPFLSVTTLRTAWINDFLLLRCMHRFVSLFKNLERLFWNVIPVSTERSYEKLCSKVREVHVCAYHWLRGPVHVHGDVQHFAANCNFFNERPYGASYGSGAITSMCAGAMSGAGVRTMAMYCPKLENLSVLIRRSNVRAIRKLVEKCQNMKRLELVYGEEEDGHLDEEGWRKIARIVPKSHKNLCQVAIQNMDSNSGVVTRLEPVFNCFERVTKALGSRAKELAFRARFRTNEAAKIWERVRELLNICMQHTPSLESFEIILSMTKDDVSDYYTGWARGLGTRLLETESRLLQEVQSLRMLDIGVSHWSLQQLALSDDSLETDSMGSKTELTSSSSYRT